MCRALALRTARFLFVWFILLFGYEWMIFSLLEIVLNYVVCVIIDDKVC